MGFPEIAAILITLAALFSYINFRFIKLPTTIGLMIFSLCLSLVIILLGRTYPDVINTAQTLIGSIDFNETLMGGMLAFLLFAGALHVDINDLAKRKLEVGLFATVGVVSSMFIIAGLVYLLAQALDLPLDFMHCLLFGALISPTDPIAVLGILKKAGAPKSLEIKLTGESLFNDGIGVVLFLALLSFAHPESGHGEPGLTDFFQLLAFEAGGGIVFGLVIGWIAFLMLKSVDNYQVEVLITLALVLGGYTLANNLHMSGPLAIVVAGLLIGNHGRQFAMSDTTRDRLDTFWELIDEILNSVLFLLIGFEVLVLTISGEYVLAGLIAIPICLFARFISVSVPVLILKTRRKFSKNVIRVLTWGGLRGGLSVAMALTLPEVTQRGVILTITYAVAAFSIIVQGLTVQFLFKGESETGEPGLG